MFPKFYEGPVLAGGAWGVLTGCTPFFQPIDWAARWALGLGLGLSYASIGLPVACLPKFGGGRRRGWLQSAVAGLLYYYSVTNRKMLVLSGKRVGYF